MVTKNFKGSGEIIHLMGAQEVTPRPKNRQKVRVQKPTEQLKGGGLDTLMRLALKDLFRNQAFFKRTMVRELKSLKGEGNHGESIPAMGVDVTSKKATNTQAVFSNTEYTTYPSRTEYTTVVHDSNELTQNLSIGTYIEPSRKMCQCPLS